MAKTLQHPVKRSPAVCPIRSATSFWWSSAPPSCSLWLTRCTTSSWRPSRTPTTCTPARPSCCPASSPEGLSGCVCRQRAVLRFYEQHQVHRHRYHLLGGHDLSCGLPPEREGSARAQVHQPVLRHHHVLRRRSGAYLPHRQADRSAGQYVGAVPARCRGGGQCHHRPQLL